MQNQKETLRPANYKRFQVADVQPCNALLPCTDVQRNLECVTRTKLLVCPNCSQQVVAMVDFHPLIAAASLAYQHHYPLALSPDMVWLTVLQGVAQHIQNNSESLRCRLVQHATKMELVVTVNGLPRNNADMHAAATAFCEQISRHFQPGKRTLFDAQFTTTSEMERIAASVILMEAMQPYFDYVMRVICGIPSVILEGTVADWELLEQKVQALDESDLELSWWTGHLLPLCRQFSRAAAGEVDRDHWNNICKLEKMYGKNDLNGWLLKFIPYVRRESSGPFTHRNPVLALQTQKEPPAPEPAPQFGPGAKAGLTPEELERLIRERLAAPRLQITGCTSNMLPTGVSSAPAMLQDLQSDALTPLQFLAGFTGVEQSPDDLRLRPRIGWAVGEPPPIDLLIHKLQTEHGCVRPSPAGLRETLDAINMGMRVPDIPGDLLKFYSEIAKVEFSFPKPNSWGETRCRILPLTFSPGQDLLRIAEASGGGHSSSYVFGAIQPRGGAAIYRCWSGENRPQDFVRIADSFSEWLETLLQAASPPNYPAAPPPRLPK